jgi:hypothetical protein
MPRTYRKKTPRVYKPTEREQTLPIKFKAGFLGTMDHRTELARVLRANYETIAEDVGGRAELGHVKGALIERFVWLETILQTLEHEMASGKVEMKATLGPWIQGLNSLTGIARVLGIERRPRVVDLKTYVANGVPELVPEADPEPNPEANDG